MRPISAIDTIRRFLLSLVILSGLDTARGIKRASSSIGKTYFGPMVRFLGNTSEIPPAMIIAIVAGNLCSCSDRKPNSADSDGVDVESKDMHLY